MAEIDISNLKPNSYAYRAGQTQQNETTKKPQGAPREKLKAVVDKGKVISKKRSFIDRFVSKFLKRDFKELKKDVVKNVIIPGVKHLILDGLSMAFFQRTINWGNLANNFTRGGSRVNYNSYYRGDSSNSSSNNGNNYYDEAPKIDYRNVVLCERADAETVVDQLRGRIQEYGSASVADLFDLVNLSGAYTDNNWGWKDPRSIGIKPHPDGWLIDVDEARYLN